MVTTKVSAIPTLYKGVRFRSRLEAKWAVMFDFLGWEWDYEPFDLAGYLPDFVLYFERPLLVEVKPIIEWIDGAWDDAHRKAKHAGVDGRFMILGAKLFDLGRGDYAIGKIYDQVLFDDGYDTLEIASPCFCLAQHCGAYNPTHYCEHSVDHGHLFSDPIKFSSIDSKWKSAGNLVQYKGARS